MEQKIGMLYLHTFTLRLSTCRPYSNPSLLLQFSHISTCSPTCSHLHLSNPFFWIVHEYTTHHSCNTNIKVDMDFIPTPVFHTRVRPHCGSGLFPRLLFHVLHPLQLSLSPPILTEYASSSSSYPNRHYYPHHCDSSISQHTILSHTYIRSTPLNGTSNQWMVVHV